MRVDKLLFRFLQATGGQTPRRARGRAQEREKKERLFGQTI